MLFTSFTFIIFFICVFFVYYLIPQKYQWIWLLVSSLFFYMFTLPYAVIFLLFTACCAFFSGLLLARHKGIAKWSVLLILLPLLITKYWSFFNIHLERIIGYSVLPAINFIVPIGISFYTFISIGYCIDVKRGAIEPERNFAKFLLYISYFPHIMQGPIDTVALSAELTKPKNFDYDNAVSGLKRVVIGFIKKIIIADRIGSLISFPNTEKGILVFWIVLLYSIQIYADFSAYMDIAIGCSKMLGINIAENFNLPYFSKSIAEFWRRWHITLGIWFKNYMYYPLLRSAICEKMRDFFKRKKNRYLMNTVPTALVLFCIWFTIGFWHGAGFNYIAHGLFHGSIIILSLFLAPIYQILDKKIKGFISVKLVSIFCIIRTFLLVTFSYFFFWSGSLRKSITAITNLFEGLYITDFITWFANNTGIIIPLGAAFMYFIYELIKYNKPVFNLENFTASLPIVVKYGIYFLLIICIIVFNDIESASFIYYKF